MSNQEKDMDLLIQNSLPELPPSDIARDVSPWRKSMNRILWGLALSAITIHFLNLNYILPTIGLILRLLGFRTLRNENKGFRICYQVTWVQAVITFVTLIINATVYHERFLNTQISFGISAFSFILLFVLCWNFRKGLILTQKKVGLPEQAGAANGLLIWYHIVGILALFGAQLGIMGAILLVFAFWYIIKMLREIANICDECGYGVKVAPVRISDRHLAGSMFFVLLIGMVFCYTAVNRYDMDWAVISKSEQDEVDEIKADLLKLGFPEEVLQDLSIEDIKMCEGAIRVITDDTVQSRHEDEVIDQLKMQGVALEIAGKKETWVIIHHFAWPDDMKFYGTEALHLWTAYREQQWYDQSWISKGELSGRVLYDENGITYAADYKSLGAEAFQQTSLLTGEEISTDVFASFSFPLKADQCRGYVSYVIEEAVDGYMINSWCNYIHQRTWIQYPAMTAKEHQMDGLWNDDAFDVKQWALQFDP